MLQALLLIRFFVCLIPVNFSVTAFFFNFEYGTVTINNIIKREIERNNFFKDYIFEQRKWLCTIIMIYMHAHKQPVSLIFKQCIYNLSHSTMVNYTYIICIR